MQTFTGLEYLKIDIASNYGLDKANWDERIAWTDAHEEVLEDQLSQAENPGLYYAAVQAYRKTQRGEPTGYPISLDAASSGLQLLSVLIGCRESASLCGVVSIGRRADAYTILYQHMLSRVGDTAKISRADCKQAIMTSLYASTAMPKRVFGTGALLEAFYETMATRAPGAWALNKGLQQLWRPYQLSHDWVLPDNFHAHIKVMDSETRYVQFLNAPVAVEMTLNRGTKEGRSISPNIVHSIDGMIVREMHRRCTYDREVVEGLMKLLAKGIQGGRSNQTHDDTMVVTLWENYKYSGFLSARILDHLRPENMGHVDLDVIRELVLSLPKKPFPIISIHDCFRVHPNYGNDLRRQYNVILSQIAKSDMLSFISSQVLERHVPVTKLEDLSADILEADYALC